MNEKPAPNPYWSPRDVLDFVIKDQAPEGGEAFVECLDKVGWAVTPKRPANEVTFAFTPTGNPEIDIMQQLVGLFGQLPEDAHGRVVDYVASRFGR